jgi:hypothetical protein
MSADAVGVKEAETTEVVGHDHDDEAHRIEQRSRFLAMRITMRRAVCVLMGTARITTMNRQYAPPLF